MIKNANTLILYREDLDPNFIEKSIKEITIASLKKGLNIEYRMADIIMFIDDSFNLKTKILKNRYGAVDK